MNFLIPKKTLLYLRYGFILLMTAGIWVACSNREPSENLVPAARRACGSPDGTTTNPSSIAATVEWINAMPKPLTLTCFLESLYKPIQITATTNVVSAQPAGGPNDPRIFILNASLVLSVVGAGEGKYNLELSELNSTSTSIKGDLVFPIEAEISQMTPFDRILYEGGGTKCRFCHTNEQVTETDNVFVSTALRPNPEQELSVESVKNLYASCTLDSEDYRCLLWNALNGSESVTQGSFSDDMPFI